MIQLVPGRTFAPGRPLFRTVVRPVRWIFRRATRLVWRDLATLPPIDEGGILIVANHVSSIDPVAVGLFVAHAGRWPTFLAKQELFRSRMGNRFFRGIGQIPVYRGTTQAGDALVEAKAALDRGETVIIYPEGTITFDDDGWPMLGRYGAGRLALETGCRVFPVAQWGANELLPARADKPGLRLRPKKTLTFVAGDEFDLSDLHDAPDQREAVRTATARFMATLTDMVADIRGLPVPDRVFDPRTHAYIPRPEP